ncbi:MAG: hypothetical protein GX660_04920 [Clostridiaceae bacterium]|nr:hypothetical protein [Clostridiaceae bacterium]
MFLYWNGYEIDGSDTTYNLVVPARETLIEMSYFFLGLPLWDKSEKIYFVPDKSEDWAPHRCGFEGNLDFNNLDEIFNAIKSPDWNGECCVVLKCLSPERLPEGLKEEIYKLSKLRPETEAAYGKALNPGASLDEGGDEIFVGFQLIDKNPDWNPDKIKLKGMVLNREALTKQIDATNFVQAEFTCGPGFYYEYAAYIMNSMSERFPSVGVFGGLDCAGGFTGGCTYASSLYRYERFKIPCDKASTVLLDLYEKGIIYFPKINKKEPWMPWKKAASKMVTFVNNLYRLKSTAQQAGEENLDRIIQELMDKKYCVDIKTYDNFVDAGLFIPQINKTDFMYDCSLHIKVADKERLIDDSIAKNIITKHLGEMDQETVNSEWIYRGFVTVVQQDQDICIELWVNWQLAPCVEELLKHFKIM